MNERPVDIRPTLADLNDERVLEAGTFEEVQGPDESHCLIIDGTQLAMLLSGVSLAAADRRRKRYSSRGSGKAA